MGRAFDVPPAAAPNGSVYVSRAPNRVLPADRSNGATIWEFDGSAHGHKPLSLSNTLTAHNAKSCSGSTASAPAPMPLALTFNDL